MTHDYNKLNILAAEKVMGWEYCKDCVYYNNKQGVSIPVSSINFCESIADAWMLVEKMEDDGWGYCVNWLDREHAHHASFNREYILHEALADLAPLAITLASLEAKGVL